MHRAVALVPRIITTRQTCRSGGCPRARLAVTGCRGLRADISESHIALDLFVSAHLRFTKSAASGGFEADDVTFPQHDVCDLGWQRFASTISDEVKGACRRGPTPR